MSEFFTQVKKVMWDSAEPEQVKEEEDNGEISPDSLDPELEHAHRDTKT